MQRIITIVLLFNSVFLNAQDVGKQEFKIRIVCGYAGITSPEVNYLQGLIKAKKHILIKQLLVGEDKISVFLSVVALNELYKKNRIILSEEELNRIREISSWNYKLSICYTCTMQIDGQVNDILSNQTHMAYILIRKELFK